MNRHNNMKILVVEDEPTIAIDIKFNLKAAGYDVVGPSHTAEKALQLLEAQHVDLALIDINLAGQMTGIDLAHKINSSYRIPFIFLTSYSDPATLEEAAKARPATYIVKPYKESDLKPAIEIALSNTSPTNLMDIIPDLDFLNTKLLSPVTKTEYEVMIDLVGGRSLKEIALKRFSSENTIKTHIKNLYSKVDIHSKMELIHWLSNIYQI